MCCILRGLTYINHDGMRRRGRRGWWFKAKGPRKKIAPSHLIPKIHVCNTSHQINSSN
jgi:hypothetical protein